MRLLLLGDLHITDKRPFCRTDEDYLDACVKKLNRAIYESDINLILQAGDFFDHYNQSYGVLSRIINILNNSNLPIISCCYGQHDMKFHSDDVSDTALNLLNLCDLISNIDTAYDLLRIYICNYNQPIPKIITPDKFNILVIHKMIIKDKLLFNQQEDYVHSHNFLKEHKFDLILSGDNHQTFVDEYEGRYLVNPGCMMRKTIDMVDHKPCYFIFDTKTNQLEQKFFEIQENPFIEIDPIKKEQKEIKEEMKGLLFLLQKKAKLEGVNFVDNLNFLSKEQREEVKIILKKSIG